MQDTKEKRLDDNKKVRHFFYLLFWVTDEIKNGHLPPTDAFSIVEGTLRTVRGS